LRKQSSSEKIKLAQNSECGEQRASTTFQTQSSSMIWQAYWSKLGHSDGLQAEMRKISKYKKRNLKNIRIKK
jgi:hypothetical protein